MALTETVADTFDDNSIDTGIWAGNYGTITETGGRARVDCDVGVYSAYGTAASYTLQGSHILSRVYPPAAGGGTDTAYASMLVVSSTAGTYAGLSIDVVSSGSGAFIGCISTSGYADPGAVYVAYSSTDHAWLRLRETSGTLYWETSPDGSTWTVQRSTTSPAWVANADSQIILEAHRGSGTDDYAEYDFFNSTFATAASATAAAGTPTPGVSPSAGAASATATAAAATPGVAAHAQAATATATAATPAATIAAGAGAAAGTGTTAATARTAPTAVAATATATTPAPTPTVAPTPQTATATGTALDGTVTVAWGRPDTGGGWYTLVDIINEAKQYALAERIDPPSACPNDGEPLLQGPDGQLYCPFDGWRPR